MRCMQVLGSCFAKYGLGSLGTGNTSKAREASMTTAPIRGGRLPAETGAAAIEADAMRDSCLTTGSRAGHALRL